LKDIKMVPISHHLGQNASDLENQIEANFISIIRIKQVAFIAVAPIQRTYGNRE